MKKSMFCGLVLVLGLLAGCATMRPAKDLGVHNPDNLPEEELVTLYIDSNLSVIMTAAGGVQELREGARSGGSRVVGWSGYGVVKVPAGIRTFMIAYQTAFFAGGGFLTTMLTPGREYILTTTGSGDKLRFYTAEYRDGVKGEEVRIDREAL